MTSAELVEAVRAHCLAKADAWEDHPWGDTVWKVGKKLFAGAGGDPPTCTVKSTLEKQAALIMHPDISVAAYVGRYGWVTIQVNEENLPLTLELIDESYASVRGKKKATG